MISKSGDAQLFAPRQLTTEHFVSVDIVDKLEWSLLFAQTKSQQRAEARCYCGRDAAAIVHGLQMDIRWFDIQTAPPHTKTLRENKNAAECTTSNGSYNFCW
jgi:hypothetical protein